MRELISVVQEAKLFDYKSFDLHVPAQLQKNIVLWRGKDEGKMNKSAADAFKFDELK